jgi:hypothetical protein
MSRPTSLYRLDDPEHALRKINWALYSWPGVGKSVFLGTGGETMLIGDCDSGGSDSAAGQGSSATAMPIRDYDELESLYQWALHDTCDGDFDFIFLDSLTLFQDRTLIDELLRDAHEQNPEKQDPDIPSKREYMKSQVKIARYVRQFCELPDINFGCTFHVMSHETPDGSVLWVPLLQGLQGEFSTKIQGYMNLLTYMYGKEKDGKLVRYLRSESNAEFTAKDRFNALPPVMKDPTVPQVRKLIEDAKAKRAAAQRATRPVKKAVAKKAAAAPATNGGVKKAAVPVKKKAAVAK